MTLESEAAYPPDKKNPRWLRLYDVQQVLEDEIKLWHIIVRNLPKGTPRPKYPDLFHAIRVMRNQMKHTLWFDAVGSMSMAVSMSSRVLKMQGA